MSVPSETPNRPNRWHPQLYRSSDGVPVLPPEIVSELGRGVLVVDVRERSELTGSIGHIPSASWIPASQLSAAVQGMARDTRIVLVSGRGRRSAEAATELEKLGMIRVASMLGGMEEWRSRGLGVSRREGTFSSGLAAAAEPTSAPDKERLTCDDIIAHIGDPNSLRWIKLAAFLMHSRISCVDGRDSQGVVGTPGGDAGEFVLAMASIESLTDTEFDAAAVEALLDDYLETFGRFYMHTDRRAVEVWVQAMRADPELDKVLPGHGSTTDQWREWFRSPPVEHRQQLLELLTQPGHIGCGHLRLMTQFSEVYGLRRGLVVAFIRGFFRRLWAGAAGLDYVVLEGDHAEQAVVNIVVDGEVWPFTRVPLIQPAGAIQIFVNHPQVVTFLRSQIAGFFALHSEIGVEPEDHGKIAARMAELGGQQLGATLDRLAKGLPIFEARFLGDGTLQVTES